MIIISQCSYAFFSLLLFFIALIKSGSIFILKDTSDFFVEVPEFLLSLYVAEFCLLVGNMSRNLKTDSMCELDRSEYAWLVFGKFELDLLINLVD